MLRLNRLAVIAILLTGTSVVALADDSNSGSQWAIGAGGQFDVVSHTWSPNINIALPLSDRILCGKVSSKSAYSNNNNLFSCQPVAMFSFGANNIENYLNSVFSSNNGDASNENPNCNQPRFYGGLGLGMQFNFGPRNPIALTAGYGADFEPNRVPHGAAYIGLAYNFGGN